MISRRRSITEPRGEQWLLSTERHCNSRPDLYRATQCITPMGILRLLLALAVVVAHVQEGGLLGLPFFEGTAYQAVSCFFIISGFYMGGVQKTFLPPDDIDFSLLWETYYSIKNNFIGSDKIDKDLKNVSLKEKELEILSKDLKMREDKLNGKESEIFDKIRDFNLDLENFRNWEKEVRKIDNEIKDWEKMHWKFKRNIKPPSVEE